MAKLIKVTQLRESQLNVITQGNPTWINADRIFRVDGVTVEIEELGTAQVSRIKFDGEPDRLLVLETPLEIAIEVNGIDAAEEVVAAGEDGDAVKVKL